jgi:hypothetical protein
VDRNLNPSDYTVKTSNKIAIKKEALWRTERMVAKDGNISTK